MPVENILTKLMILVLSKAIPGYSSTKGNFDITQEITTCVNFSVSINEMCEQNRFKTKKVRTNKYSEKSNKVVSGIYARIGTLTSIKSKLTAWRSFTK